MEVKEKVKQAFRRFMAKDNYLLTVESNERSLTHRLAIYVEQEFPDYNVDCEFNRDGIDVKRLAKFRNKEKVEPDDTRGVSVFPDIIVHHRNTDNNFIVIEAKTSSNYKKEACQKPKAPGAPNPCPCDRCKLEAYKMDLKYTHAFFVVFPVGDDLKNYSEGHADKYLIETLEDNAQPVAAANKVHAYLKKIGSQT